MDNTRGLRDIRHYRKYLQTFDHVKTIKLGYLYSYIYKSLDYPHQVIRWFDLMPLSFIFSMNKKKKLASGLNLHHLPVRTRMIWLARIKRLFKAKFSKNKESKDFNKAKRLQLTYRRLMLIMMKSKFGIRQYRFSGIGDLRIIPNNFWDTVLKYYANTYNDITYTQKVKQYQQWSKDQIKKK